MKSNAEIMEKFDELRKEMTDWFDEDKEIYYYMKSKAEIMEKFDELRKDITDWLYGDSNLSEEEDKDIYYSQGDVMKIEGHGRYMLALFYNNMSGEPDEWAYSDSFSLVCIEADVDGDFIGRIWRGRKVAFPGRAFPSINATSEKISHTDLSKFIGKEHSFKKVASARIKL